MLFSGASSFRDALIQILLLLPIILISLTVHEYSHGYAAYRLGDSTARNLGRLTLNPIKHIDPLGFLFLFLAGFGWAKPVPINSRNLKHGKSGLAIVSLAGPLSNLLLGFIGMIVFRLCALYLITSLPVTIQTMLMTFLQLFIYINVGLFVFNLFPIPPLDGSRIISVLLPSKWAYYYLRYEMYIQIALFILLAIGVLSPVILALRSYIIGGMNFILNFIPFLH